MISKLKFHEILRFNYFTQIETDLWNLSKDVYDDHNISFESAYSGEQPHEIIASYDTMRKIYGLLIWDKKLARVSNVVKQNNMETEYFQERGNRITVILSRKRVDVLHATVFLC